MYDGNFWLLMLVGEILFESTGDRFFEFRLGFIKDSTLLNLDIDDPASLAKGIQNIPEPHPEVD